MNKVIASAAEAVADVADGAMIAGPPAPRPRRGGGPRRVTPMQMQNKTPPPPY